MSKKNDPNAPLWTVLVWNKSDILIRRGVPKSDVELCRLNMQTTIEDPEDVDTSGVDGTDIRWQAWEGHAKVEVI